MAVADDNNKTWDWALRACHLEPDALVSRIVIDIKVDDVVRVYAEMYGSHDRLDVAPPDIDGAKITILGAEKGATDGNSSLGA